MVIKVLDVTLRDGGCVIDFNFGTPYMHRLLDALERSDVDCIELGYIDNKKGTEKGRTQYLNDQVVFDNFNRRKKEGTKYYCMIDYGKFEPKELIQSQESMVDGIRYCFHKKDYKNILSGAREILKKGYELYLQPMITLRYSDEEFLDFIDMVNRELPETSGVYVVDSFGEMRPDDVGRFISVLDHNLNKKITMGFHSHNNLQLSYANGISFLQYPTVRDKMLDSSIMGMGKGAGNLNTELLLEHMNLFYGTNYKINPLLEVIDEVLNQIHSEHYWGYAIEYYLSSVNKCTPSYAAHFYNKHMLTVPEVNELLSWVKDEKKISFDKAYADQLYEDYKSRSKYDDTDDVHRLSEQLKNKKVLLIAPGRSIMDFKEAVIEKQKIMPSISINFTDICNTPYTLITKSGVITDWNGQSNTIIVTSNVHNTPGSNCYIIDYKTWIDNNQHSMNDSGSIIAINLLKKIGVKKIYFAGFDGFSSDVTANYCNMLLRRPIDSKTAEKKNAFYKQYFKTLSKEIEIEFITPSLYMDDEND